MADSLLRSFVTGTRAMLSAQLFVSVGAVGLAGWTLGVTNELIRERDRLQERVIQLEETMASQGAIPPPAPAVVDPAPQGEVAYPGSIEEAQIPPQPVDAQPQAPAPADAQGDTPSRADDRDFGRIIGDLFAPPPPLRTVVLHVRSPAEEGYAQRIAVQMMEAGDIRVLTRVTREQRPPGYAYFDGRQSRAAAETVTRFHDIARSYELAPWAAQLRGVALPAQGEYTADRLDIVLPPLQSSRTQTIDPRQLEMQRLERVEPQQRTDPVR